MKKGLRKWRAVDGEENQNQVSHRCPSALGNRWRDSHIPAAPAHGPRWKSGNPKTGFPLFHAFFVYSKSKSKGESIPACYSTLQAHLWIRKRCRPSGEVDIGRLKRPKRSDARPFGRRNANLGRYVATYQRGRRPDNPCCADELRSSKPVYLSQLAS